MDSLRIYSPEPSPSSSLDPLSHPILITIRDELMQGLYQRCQTRRHACGHDGEDWRRRVLRRDADRCGLPTGQGAPIPGGRFWAASRQQQAPRRRLCAQWNQDHLSNGDPVPVDALFGPEGNFDIYAWCAKHGADVARPPLDNVIRALKGSGVTSVGAVGYCYGGRWVFDLAFDGAISVATVAHPSLLAIPADIEKYIATAKAPLLINCCEFDEQFGQEAKKTADALFAGYAPGYKSVYFEGCTHGFAVRGDLSDLKVKAGKEVAFKETVEWVRKHL